MNCAVIERYRHLWSLISSDPRHFFTQRNCMSSTLIISGVAARMTIRKALRILDSRITLAVGVQLSQGICFTLRTFGSKVWSLRPTPSLPFRQTKFYHRKLLKSMQTCNSFE
jgi:hypothetical protein